MRSTLQYSNRYECSVFDLNSEISGIITIFCDTIERSGFWVIILLCLLNSSTSNPANTQFQSVAVHSKIPKELVYFILKINPKKNNW